MLAGSPAARANDERRALGRDLVERAVLVGDLLRGVGLRRLGAAVVLDEQGSALGAVVRGLRVLEAALRAVDEAQESPWSGGVAFPARIAVSDSTSTLSRTLWPPVFCSRATSSARRMSILPCRIRRW